MTDFIQLLISGLSIGSIYALVGLGFIFAINGVSIVNMAHGEVLMLGAFFAVTGATVLNLPLIPAYIVGIVGTIIIGYILNLVIIRPLIKKPLFIVMIATIGLSMALRNTAMNIWGANAVGLDGLFGNQVININNIVISYQNILVIAVLAVVLLLQSWFFRRTLTGKQLRAMSLRPKVARLLGVPVKKLTYITIMVSCGLAGLAGVLMGPIYFVSFSMGSIALAKGFTATIIGGFGRIEGTVIGGILLGIIETLMASYVSPTFKDGFAFLVLILILIIKPTGILGEATSQRV